MTVDEVISRAEAILPGRAAPEGEIDPRWQAIIEVAEFMEPEPDAVWSSALRWGNSPDEDLRAAIATCVLEHLLEHDFDLIFPRVESAVRERPLFAKTVQMCSEFGQSAEHDRAVRLRRLMASLHGKRGEPNGRA